MAVLLAANASFIPTSPLHALGSESAIRWGMEELNERAELYGHGGIELLWSHVLKHCHDLKATHSDEIKHLGRGIVSMHEGWRGVADPRPLDASLTPLRPVTERESLLVKLGGFILFPTGPESLKSLGQLEGRLDRQEPIHYVMFPDEKGRVAVDRDKTAIFPNSSIQPTADVAASWGANTVGDIVEGFKERGYLATLDDFHFSREGKIVKNKLNWKDLIKALLQQQMVPEVHVRSGGGFAGVDPKRVETSKQEIRALVNNGSLEGTPLGYMAELLAEHKWSGNVVDEVTTPDLLEIFGKQTPKSQTELRQHIAAGIKKLLPHVKWESRLASPV